MPRIAAARELVEQLDNIHRLAASFIESSHADWPEQLALTRRIQRVVSNAKQSLVKLSS